MIENEQVMKKQFENLDIDKVEDIMDDIQDTSELLNEFGDALARNNNPALGTTEELMGELEDIMNAEDGAIKASPTKATPAIPVVNEDEDLEDLMSSYAQAVQI